MTSTLEKWPNCCEDCRQEAERIYAKEPEATVTECPTAQAWEITAGLTISERLVMVVLAHHMNSHTWRCAMSLAQVARFAAVSESTARAALRTLRGLGLIAYTPAPGGRSWEFWWDRYAGAALIEQEAW